MTADQALAGLGPGTRPLLVVHRSYQGNSALSECSHEMARVAGRVELAVSCEMSSTRRSSENVARFFDEFPGIALRIADPALHKHALSWGQWEDREPPEHLARAAPVPDRIDTHWLEALLDLQWEAGGTVLLTPVGRLSEIDPDASLDMMLAWIRATREAIGNGAMFAAMTLPSSWLQEGRLLDRFLEEFVSSRERYWWLRVRWPMVEPRFGQLRDAALLDGYRELAETAAAEDKVVVLPNSGLSGWVCTALGMGGFGTGTSWGEQAFAEERRIATRPGVPPPPRRNRYFERSLLHTIDITPHTALIGQPGYVRCDCRWCQTLNADDPRMDPTTWNREAAGYHYLYQVARLSTLTVGARGRDRVLREVRRAQTFSQNVDPAVGLTGEATPRHLTTWEQLLAP